MRPGLTALVAFFLVAPAAHAAPTLTVSAGGESATPFVHHEQETSRATGMGRSVFASPAGLPVLVAPAGTQITLTLGQPVVDATAAIAGMKTLATTRTSDRTFTTTVPSDASFPLNLAVHADYSTAEVIAKADYLVTLSPAAPSVSNLRLKGSRLSVDVACPVGCAGFVTLKTSKLRVVRFQVKGPGTLTAKVRPAALRHLERHRVKRLRVVLTTTGRAPEASSLKLG